MNRYHQLEAKWLQVSLAIVIAIGIFFRLVNLDQKPYWHDETFTSLRVSGYTTADVMKRLYNGQEISAADLHHYQTPSLERSAIDTIKGLAVEEPQHPPLYYVMARFWAQWFGSSVKAMRSLPALISLLSFPAIYWLCLELFGSAMTGWMAAALFAVSPLYVRYAQDARQYSLWTVLILLSSVALLRAIRCKTKLSWSIYTLTAIAGLYCHLLSSLVLLGQGLYMLEIERFRPTKNLILYLLSSLISLVMLLPWFWEIRINQHAFAVTTDWLKQPLPFLALIKYWSISLCQLFVAWHFRYNDVLFYLAVPTLLLLVFAICVLCRQTSKPVWLLVVSLIGVTALALVLPDLLWGGQRSISARYFLPCYLGIQLAIAYLLTTQLFKKRTSILQLRLWQTITALVISAGVLTCTVSAQANTWWGWSEFDVEVSKIVNQFPRPLIISEMPVGMIMPLSHRLNPEIKLMLLTKPDLLKIPQGYSDVFIYNLSDHLPSKLRQQGFQLDLVYQFRDSSLLISLYHLKSHKSVQPPRLKVESVVASQGFLNLVS